MNKITIFSLSTLALAASFASAQEVAQRPLVAPAAPQEKRMMIRPEVREVMKDKREDVRGINDVAKDKREGVRTEKQVMDKEHMEARIQLKGEVEAMKADMKKQLEAAKTPEEKKKIMDSMKDAKDGLMGKRDDMKKSIKTDKRELVEKRVGIARDRVTEVGGKVEQTVARLAELVAKEKARGVDVTKAEAAIVTATAAVATAKADAQKVEALMAAVRAGTANRSDIEVTVTTARTSLLASHKALRAVIEALPKPAKPAAPVTR